jgi:hypothetical protein
MNSFPFVYLSDIAPDVEAKINYQTYNSSEQNYINPKLRQLGYEFDGQDWRSGEADAFGPLSRYVPAIDPNGNNVNVCYG